MAAFRSKLINEVKKYPCLYIEDNPAFKDTAWKNEAWKQISKSLNLEVSFLQEKWMIWRNLYELVLYIRRNSENCIPYKNIRRFEKEMKFMEYYLQPKKTPPPMINSLPTQHAIVQMVEPEMLGTTSSESTNETTEPEIQITIESTEQEIQIVNDNTEPEVQISNEEGKPVVQIPSSTTLQTRACETNYQNCATRRRAAENQAGPQSKVFKSGSYTPITSPILPPPSLHSTRDDCFRSQPKESRPSYLVPQKTNITMKLIVDGKNLTPGQKIKGTIRLNKSAINSDSVEMEAVLSMDTFPSSGTSNFESK